MDAQKKISILTKLAQVTQRPLPPNIKKAPIKPPAAPKTGVGATFTTGSGKPIPNTQADVMRQKGFKQTAGGGFSKNVGGAFGGKVMRVP